MGKIFENKTYNKEEIFISFQNYLNSTVRYDSLTLESECYRLYKIKTKNQGTFSFSRYTRMPPSTNQKKFMKFSTNENRSPLWKVVTFTKKCIRPGGGFFYQTSAVKSFTTSNIIKGHEFTACQFTSICRSGMHSRSASKKDTPSTNSGSPVYAAFTCN